jgi:hypothetical protein
MAGDNVSGRFDHPAKPLFAAVRVGMRRLAGEAEVAEAPVEQALRG